MSKALEIFTDGASKGNPGPAGIGVVIYQDGRIIKEISKAIGTQTNNFAEYTAVIYALQEALILKATAVKIHTDSELISNQIKGHRSCDGSRKDIGDRAAYKHSAKKFFRSFENGKNPTGCFGSFRGASPEFGTAG